MAQYISKDALLAEIDRRICTHIVMQRKPEMSDLQEELQNKIDCLKSLKGFINNTLEVKEVQEEPVSEYLEEEIQKTIHNHFFDLNGIAIAGTSVYATVDDMVYIAKHFANWQKEQMMKDAIDAKLLEGHLIRQKGFTHSLHVGDKVKVIIIKSE